MPELPIDVQVANGLPSAEYALRPTSMLAGCLVTFTDAQGIDFPVPAEQIRDELAPGIKRVDRDPRANGLLAALPGKQNQEARHIKDRGAYDVYVFENGLWQIIQSVGPTLNTTGGTVPNAAPTATLSASASALFVGQSFTLTGTATDPDGSIATFDIYEGGQLLQRFTQQPYLLTVTPTAAGEKTYIGVATDNLGLARQSAPQTVRALTAANQLPLASLSTSVERGVVGQAMNITVLASDPDGYVTGVSIYNGPKLLGTIGSAPYSLTYTPGAVGTLQLLAIVTDDKGGQRTTEPKLLPVVAGAQSSVPSVALQAPSSGTVGSAIALIASAVDTDGTVTKVEYYDASNKLGETTALPHTFSYTPVNPGTYFFRALVTDNDGNKGESGTITCVVSAVATANTTPAAPTFSGFDDTQEGGTVTLVLSPGIPLSEHRVSLPGSTAFTAPASTTITVPNAAGTVRAYTIATSSRNQSPTGTSQAFTAYTPPVTPTFNTTLNPGEYADVVTYNGATGTQFLFNAPLPSGDPAPAVMLVFLNGTQVGQVDFNGNVVGTACAVKVNGTLYLTTFQNSDNVALSA